MADVASIADVWISVLPDTSKIAPKIKEALRTTERELKAINVDVKADTAAAKAEIERLDGQTVKVKVDVDRSALDRAFSGFGGGGSGGGFGGGGAFKINAGLVGVGLLPAAALAVTNLAGALQQLAGAGAVIPGVFAGIASSVGVAKLSMQGMSDAYDAVTKAADGTQASVDAANKALEDLSPNAAEAVKTVVGLKGTFTELRNIGSQNMFAGVSQGLMGLVGNLLPAATRGVDGISRSLNQNLLQAMTSLGSGSSQGFLERIFGNTANAQGRLSAAIDPIVNGVLRLAAAGTDSLPRLADAVGKVAERFNAFITSADGDGRLNRWITDGLTGFTNLGNIVLNLGKSFTAITGAAGGGASFLSTLQGLTASMSTFLNSTEGQNKLKGFFETARQQFGQLRDIAVQLGPVLAGAFQAGLNATSVWLPVIRQVLDILNRIPGGAEGVITAVVAWKTIQGPASLLSSLSNLGNTMGGLGGKATAAGNAMNSALSLAGPIAAAFALQEAYKGVLGQIDKITGTNYATQLDSMIGPGNAASFVWGQATGNPQRDAAQAKVDAARQAAIASGQAPAAFAGGGAAGAQAQRRGFAPGGRLSWANGVGPTPIPAISTYTPPVVTEAPSGTPNLPYAGTADPYAGMYSSIPYGLPAGTNTGGYGSGGAGIFPGWVQQLSAAFGVTPSTYAGHQESDRNEAGYAPNPGHENRGIDWTGTPEAMQKFADYLKNVPGMEQVIWNGAGIGTGDTVEIAGGRSQPGYFAGDLAGHGNHVHTRQSGPIPLPGMDPMSTMTGGLGDYGATGLTSSDLSLRNAQQRVNDTQHSEEQAQGRLNELRAKGTATDRQMEAAEYALAKAKREHQDAIDGLTVATDKYNKSAQAGSTGGDSGMSGLGGDLFGGVLEAIGLDGSLFKNPFASGMWKGVTGVANFAGALGQAKAGQDPGSMIPGGSGGGLGGLLGMASSFMPGMPGGNSLNIADAAQFKPPGVAGPGNPAPAGYQNGGIDLRGASFGDSHGELTNQINAISSSQQRYAPLTQNLPK